jgi:hypothetical protein
MKRHWNAHGQIWGCGNEHSNIWGPPGSAPRRSFEQGPINSRDLGLSKSNDARNYGTRLRVLIVRRELRKGVPNPEPWERQRLERSCRQMGNVGSVHDGETALVAVRLDLGLLTRD